MSRRSLSLAAGLAGLCLLAAGCGGSKAPSVASLTKPAAIASTANTSAASAQIRSASCIRFHGVPNFPDPNSEGEVNLAGININSPQFMAAHQACQSLVPPNHGRTPAQQRQLVQQELAIARCMRKHGVPNFPDPDSQTGVIPGNTWRSMTSPIAEKAVKICNPGTG